MAESNGVGDSSADERPPDDATRQTPAEAGPQQDAPAAEPWDSQAAQPPLPGGSEGEAGPRQAAGPHDESLDYDGRMPGWRIDFPVGSQFRDVAGEIHNHYNAGTREKERSPGRISVADLRHALAVHVTTPSDAALRESLSDQRVVFCRGTPETGRSQSATIALDHLTGYSRTTSKIIVIDGTSGLAGLLDQLEAGCGHLLDASEAPWAETISTAQLNQVRTALGVSGSLSILVDADGAQPLPGPVIDHARPDLHTVAVFHLAVRLTGDGPADWEMPVRTKTQARAAIADACSADEETRDWFTEIASAPTSTPAGAVLFAEAIWDWHKRRWADPAATPRAAKFRGRHRYEQAARLLRHHDGVDSPLRQSYAIAAAVLDGLALNEVIDGAGQLGVLLTEVEHPGEPGQREVFARPFVRWLRHAELASPDPGSGDTGGIVVKMPSREFARNVIELAWREYDAARMPMLTWLRELCERHRDDRVRIRAVQALAFIAAHDYALIKERVLNVWSSPDSRPVERLAASWLLEAMVRDGTSVSKVRELIRLWSRSPEPAKRAVAVLAYGTAVASGAPQDAVQGVRISAILPDGGSLPELALCDMYLLGLTREVTSELTSWMHGFPAMRERAGRALVRISQIRLRDAHGDAPRPYDLLWLLARAPDEVGASLTQVARLWHVACSYERSRSAGWQMLGRWAQSCRDFPELSGTFAGLADEFEKAATDDELRGRLSVYRRRWNSYLDEETQK